MLNLHFNNLLKKQKTKITEQKIYKITQLDHQCKIFFILDYLTYAYKLRVN